VSIEGVFFSKLDWELKLCLRGLWSEAVLKCGIDESYASQ
jgi:hypothetical protein